MPVERSGQEVLDFEYGEDFGARIEAFAPTFRQGPRRWNPEDESEIKLVRLND